MHAIDMIKGEDFTIRALQQNIVFTSWGCLSPQGSFTKIIGQAKVEINLIGLMIILTITMIFTNKLIAGKTNAEARNNLVIEFHPHNRSDEFPDKFLVKGFQSFVVIGVIHLMCKCGLISGLIENIKTPQEAMQILEFNAIPTLNNLLEGIVGRGIRESLQMQTLSQEMCWNRAIKHV